MLSAILATGLTVLLTSTCLAHRIPFNAPTDSAQYEFEWPIKDVAIIGAGVSGLLAYRSLSEKDHFKNIRIFERDEKPGGNWHYTDEIARSIPIEIGETSDWWKADYVPEIPEKLPFCRTYKVESNGTRKEDLEKKRIQHRQPKPIWKTLRANTPAPQQQVPGFTWPPGVEWASHHSKVQRYLRSFASWLGINNGDDNPDVSYNTRVELVSKRLDKSRKQIGWSLLLRKFVENEDGSYREAYWEENFDAVVVAAGRFNIPHIPAIPGLVEWQKRFPEQIIHSRQYRFGSTTKGKNVIVVGASASATGISLDINAFASTSYLSIREDSNDPRAPVRRQTHLNQVPPNTTIIGEIKRFRSIPAGEDISKGEIELLNGTIITGIDQLVFGTGQEQPIVTDGTHVRSLYLDVFYIDQPTLAFQGQNVGIQTFSYGKYTSEAIARVWSGQAHLPHKQALWRHFWNTVEERGGLKKGFQWLQNQAEARYLRHFVSWLNSEAVTTGAKLLDLPPDVSEQMDLWMKARAAGVTVDPNGRNDFWGDSLGINQEIEWKKAVLDDW
ncbi:uncharacterized protein L201_007555 [Kwoniella dendrophila CBS 6074]|uniref:FAD/NAD(P)-binding domain-containing protein n=1 Tax=Kwoniella dendrophila CBS 6074 TaxID=1295534 RepID=A0AAX4K4D9_9TREE